MNKLSPRRRIGQAGLALLGVLFGVTSTTSLARCPNPTEVMEVAAAYVNKTPAEHITAIKNLQDAYCAQGMIAAEIGRSMGVMVGYKAAFTSAHMQRAFGADAPQRGYLYEKMFLKNGATVPSGFGALPQVGADLLLIVKDYRIHDAQTALEVLQHISYVVPFIELSDLIWADTLPVTHVQLVAANMGTRLGVLGTPIPVQATQEFLDGLASMTIVMHDEEGVELGRAQGKDVLGNPVFAVQWLAQDLARNGQRIQMDDRIAIGAFFPGHVPATGKTFTVRYQGLPGDPSVAVKFK